jgi:hypothetical protein
MELARMVTMPTFDPKRDMKQVSGFVHDCRVALMVSAVPRRYWNWVIATRLPRDTMRQMDRLSVDWEDDADVDRCLAVIYPEVSASARASDVILMTRKPGDALSDLADRLRQAGQGVDEDVLVAAFVRMLPADVSKVLAAHDMTTLAAAADKACRIEALTAAAAVATPAAQPERRQSQAAAGATQTSQAWAPAPSPGASAGAVRQSMGVCHGCGQAGHFKRNCPYARDRPREPEPAPRAEAWPRTDVGVRRAAGGAGQPPATAPGGAAAVLL